MNAFELAESGNPRRSVRRDEVSGWLGAGSNLDRRREKLGGGGRSRRLAGVALLVSACLSLGASAPARPIQFGEAEGALIRRGHVDPDTGRVVRDPFEAARDMFLTDIADHEVVYDVAPSDATLVALGRFEAFEDEDTADPRAVSGTFVLDEVFKGNESPGDRVSVLLRDGVLASAGHTRSRGFVAGKKVLTTEATLPRYERGAKGIDKYGDVTFVRPGITMDDEGGAIRLGETYLVGVAEATGFPVRNDYPFVFWGDEAQEIAHVVRRELALAARCTEWRLPWISQSYADGGLRHAMGRFFSLATPDLVADCLANETPTSFSDELARTPLHHAARYSDDPAVVRLLLAAGAGVDAEDREGCTPVGTAADNEHGNVAVLAALLEANGRLSPDCTDTALHAAARNKGDAMFPMAVAAGGDPDARAGECGGTPVQAAAEYCGTRSTACASFSRRFAILVEAGAEPSPRDACGNTALHYAAKGRREAVETLVAVGGDVEARNDEGATPLHVAAGEKFGADVVSALLAAGADPAAVDGLGATPCTGP